jgi:hypothetical protein
MERTNLNFSTVKTNLDDKNNLIKNNYVETNNYTRQNLFLEREKKKTSNQEKYENSDEYLTNQRNRQATKKDFVDNEYTRRKVIPISQKTEKFKVTRINVDSRYRNKDPKNILDSVQHFLPNNPFFFQKGSNLLTIYDPNHNYNYDDKIVLMNLNISSISSKIVFEKNNFYVKVEYLNHNMNHNYNYIILIENFIGNSQNNTLFDNVPVNYLNKIHNVLFTNGKDMANNDYFYIQINIKPSINNNSVVDVKLYSLNGIPLNNIKSNYPININQSQSSVTISNILSNNYYQVSLSKNATVGLTNNSDINNLINGVGGSDIVISKIVDVIEGFPDSNHFKFNLGRNFKNVKKIKLLSTEIPNTEKMVKDYPPSKKNNLLYWQNVDDGDYIYSVEITPGNYTTDELSSEIQSQINKIPRINPITTNSSVIIYLNDHFVTVAINQNSNLFSVSYYTTVILSQAIIKSTYNFEDGFDRIIVHHPSHKLNSNDTILIQNALATEGIPTSTLNGTFVIESIIDVDNYQIKLDKYNKQIDVTVTNGGDAVKVLTPLQTRLLFNNINTIGSLLGFRNVGDYNAITIYSKTITNTIEYELDSNLNSLGIYTSNIISNLLFNFNGDNYIYLTMNYIFSDSIDIKGIKNIFAKLLFSGDPNSVIYNDFIQIGEEFIDPIYSLNEIEFFFYTPDGLLYDFNNINLSFTIEIFEGIE